jgi:hypothetical protein
MNLIRLFGVSALVLGLAACGESEKSAMSDAVDKASDAAAATQDAVKETAVDMKESAVNAVKDEAELATEKVKSKFDTEKFAEGSGSDVSTAPAPSFFQSENLKPGEYINEQGEVVKNRDLETVKENPKLNEVPEGIEPGSVEHTMWLLSQPEDPE